jgi:hypothetical protein
MSQTNNIASRIQNGVVQAMDCITYSVSNAEPLEKVAKQVERTIQVAKIVMGTISTAFSNLGEQLKDTVAVLETLRFISVMNLLLTPKDGKYYFSDPRNSWQKCVDRVALAFHTFCKTIKGLVRFGFADLGFMAKDAIGKLPIFTLVMDSFMLTSSSFGIWDTFANTMPKAREKQKEGSAHLEKWEYRLTDIDMLKINDKSTCNHFEARYKNKTNELHVEIAKLEKAKRFNEDKLKEAWEMKEKGENIELAAKTIAECNAEIKKIAASRTILETKVEKTERRINMIAENNFKGLAEDLEKANIKFKIKKWEVFTTNSTREEIKAWSRVANSVSKITVILFAFVLTALNLWTTPFMLSMLAMGFIVDTIGLTKLNLEKFLTPLPTPVPIVEIA